jgi:diguanylate cyclase (GGDEF)-like protein
MGEHVVMTASQQAFFSSAYQPFYLFFFVICLIIAGQVYGRIQSNIGRQSETKAFRRIIRVYVIYIFEDMTWVLLSFHTHLHLATTLLEYIQSGILALFTFCWFLFAEHYIDGFPVMNRKYCRFYAVPLTVAGAVTVSFCLNLVGAAGNGLWQSFYLYLINSVVDTFYLAFAFLHTLIRALREKRKAQRQRFVVILECILYPAVGATASFFISYVPFIIMMILPSIIKVLIEMQNANIYTDALTGINNRYRVNEYLEKSWEHVSKTSPIVLYMIDINKFKGINDKYGHLEGDHALVIIANCLKKLTGEGIVIGRFGGDEFILVDTKNHDPKETVARYRSYLADAAKEQNLPYSLTVAFGYAVCTDPTERIEDVQKRADLALYEDKRAL